MTYRDRIAAAQVRRVPTSSSAQTACGSQPVECNAMFEVIGQALDDIKAEQAAARQAFSELSERMASQETTAKNLWHQVRAVEEGVKAIPGQLAQALERHEDTCAGRDYARAKLTASTTRSDVPLADLRGDTTQSIRQTRSPDTGFAGDAMLPGGIPLPKLILYFGGGIGAAIAGAAYLLSLLGVFGGN